MQQVRTHLKALLREQGLSLRGCGRETGLSQGALLAWCNGPLDNVNSRVLAALCAYLGCSLAELLYLADA